MRLSRVFWATLFLLFISTASHAKENKSKTEQVEKAKQELINMIGTKTGNVHAKEIPEGFVFDSGKGKVTLLILWSRSCKSCITDIPNLNRILLDFKGKVNIIAIELDGMTGKELQQFAKEKKILYTLMSGTENRAFVSKIMDKFEFDKKLPFQIVLGYTGHNNGVIKGIAKLDDMERFLQQVIDHYEKKPAKTSTTPKLSPITKKKSPALKAQNHTMTTPKAKKELKPSKNITKR